MNRTTPTTYVAYNRDSAIRQASSSGGIFTALASHIIAQGGVVFGACFDDAFQVVHRKIETIEDLAACRGSKYVKSNLGDSYQQAQASLQQGVSVLFTGTPCQIAGLYAYLDRAYHNLYTHDFICHGVPRPTVWNRYLSHIQKEGAHLCQLSHRDKVEGWKRFSLSCGYDDGDYIHQTLDKDPYLQAFLTDLCLLPSCYHCPHKGLHRPADLTLADAWGAEHYAPHWDDDLGLSLILIHSPKGQSLLEAVAPHIAMEVVDIHQASRYNPSLTQSAPVHPNGKRFLSDLDTYPFPQAVARNAKHPLAHRILRRLRHVV